VICSEGLSNNVSNINKRYIENMKFAASMYSSFIIFFHVLLVTFSIVVCMVVYFVFCLIL
jgi:hypothetical protein